MAITQEQFDQLVSKLESFSQSHPRLYRLRVALFAVLGYGYIFMMLFGSLGLIGLSILYIKYSPRVHTYVAYVIAFQVVIVIMIVRSLWVTFSPPQGLKLSRRQVPQLFSLVDELTTKLQAPKFHNILLNQEFNAAVVQIPRLGIFGWQRNYLLLGLPLLHSLSVEQLKAVLAHELGHLSGNHSRFAAWIYRIRKTWMQVYERFQRSHQGQDSSSVWSAVFTIWSGLFNIFLDWYWPAFNAYSFVLARMNEYEADHCGVQLAGAKNMAEALVNVEIKTRFLESSFWPGIHQQVEHQADPPDNVYSSMLQILQEPIATEQSHQWLEQAIAQKTNNIDTHPCLSDRLQSLGYLTPPTRKLPEIATVKVSAAASLLDQSLQEFTQQFNQDWQMAVSTSWRQRYGYLTDTRRKLEALERNAQTQTLNEQELWERAYYTRELQGNEAALPLLQNLLKVQPNHAEANYALGQLLLEKADSGGVDYIEKAITQRIDWAVDGYQLIYSFFWQQGQTEAAETYRQRAENHYQTILKAQQERADVYDRDKFKPHTLKAEEVSKLKQQLATFPEIKEAYLVEKIVHYFPEDRFCVLGIIRSKGIIESEVAPFKLVESLVKEIQFPVQAYIIVLNHGSSSGIRKNICQVNRSLIFQRSPSK
jgi:Zn-dependent protease with chaperone function